jgi:putative sterol carrier protein
MSEQTKDWTVAEFTHGMREKLSGNPGLEATIKFVLDGGDIIFIDGKAVPHSVTNDDYPADVTLKMSLETLNKLRRKQVNPMVAVMMGQIKLEGNAMAALKLDKLLG